MHLYTNISMCIFILEAVSIYEIHMYQGKAGRKNFKISWQPA